MDLFTELPLSFPCLHDLGSTNQKYLSPQFEAYRQSKRCVEKKKIGASVAMTTNLQ